MADQLVFSCRSPLIHPYTTRQITETLFTKFLSNKTAKSTKRNIILYASRSSGDTRNDGRRIVNERQVISALEKMLKLRRRGEQLQFFRSTDFKNLNELTRFLANRVKAFIGPHGGAFYNARLLRPGSLILEIIPRSTSFFAPCFWEQSRLLGQDYAVYVGEPIDGDNDMKVADPVQLAVLVQKRLENRRFKESNDAIAQSYPWRVDE
jgi:capsular polysaccharide biosynthesis protein